MRLGITVTVVGLALGCATGVPAGSWPVSGAWGHSVGGAAVTDGGHVDGLGDLRAVASGAGSPVASLFKVSSTAATDSPAPREVDLPPEVLAIVGDREYGEYLGSECLACHQTDGANDGIPGIVGWPTEDFVIAMHAYRLKLRPNPVMQTMAGRLSDEEIAALAVYFGQLQP